MHETASHTEHMTWAKKYIFNQQKALVGTSSHSFQAGQKRQSEQDAGISTTDA